MLTLLWLCLAQVDTGLDRLQADNFSQLNGKRVALLTNHSAIDRKGRHILDILAREKDLHLVALLAPEHGWKGKLDQENIGNEQDPSTGLTIFSLYGDTRKPTKNMLKNVDILLFDIQDIGTRFYTYQTTLLYALEACAEFGVEALVLDRPNPLGGFPADGPMLDPDRRSFTGAFPMPVRHGMTMGELARLFAKELELDLTLTVVRMRGWRRGMGFEETGLIWINPSPNMRSPRQARLYPGIALFEYTNLSVGRGTDTPFERLGAPWLDHLQLVQKLRTEDLQGVRFVAHQFTPTSGPFAGEVCNGIMILLEDQKTFDPFATAYTLFRYLYQLHPDTFQPGRFIRLLANKTRMDQLLAGTPAVEVIRSQERAEAALFWEETKSFRLYPSTTRIQ